MIKISLYFTHQHVESELVLKDKNVVVIDVLRTSTTMAAGLANGAMEIIPTEDAIAAGRIGRLKGHSLWQRNKIIEGFDLGNNKNIQRKRQERPDIRAALTEYGFDKVKFARNCVVLGLRLSRVVDYLAQLKETYYTCAEETVSSASKIPLAPEC
jgi:hypothetical protein